MSSPSQTVQSPQRPAVTERPWLFALFLMPLGIPIVLWGGWETITAPESTPARLAIAAGLILLTYVGAALLLWFNARMQTFWNGRR